MKLSGREGSWIQRAAVVAVSFMLATLMGLPVLTDPANRLFGSEIVGRAHDPYTAGVALYEHPGSPTVRTQPVTDYPGAALAAVTGSGVVAYNLFMLATFPLAALTAFLLARFLTGSSVVGWISGLFYAFAPFHVAHAAYHPHIAQIQWLPFYFWLLWRCLERASRARCLALALAATCISLSSFYSGLIALVLSPIAVLVYWSLETRRRNPRAGRDVARALLTLTVVGLGGLAFVLVQAPEVFADPSSLAYPRSDLNRYSARWYSYFVPPVGHPLFGGWVSSFWKSRGTSGALVEQQLTLGAGLLALAGAALLSWMRDTRDRLSRCVPVLTILGLVSFVCSLAPEWVVGGYRLPRLSALLFDTLPMFRAYARFGLVVILVVGVLAGIGMVSLLRSGSRLATLVAVTALVTSVIELTPFPPWRWHDVLPTKSHRWLNDLPAKTSVPIRALDCVSAGDRAAATAMDLFRHDLWLLGPRSDCGEPGLAVTLAARGATHLITRSGSHADAWLAASGRQAGFMEQKRFDDSTVYAIEQRVPSLGLEILDGFYRREYQGARSFRWMREQGMLALVNYSEDPLMVDLALVVHAFPMLRRICVDIDGAQVAELTVATTPGWVRVPPFEVASGPHNLRLRALEPEVTPDQVRGTGDRRRLTIALGDWRISEAKRTVETVR